MEDETGAERPRLGDEEDGVEVGSRWQRDSHWRVEDGQVQHAGKEAAEPREI